MGLPAFQYCLWNKSWRLKGSPCSRTGHHRLCLVSSSSEHTPCTRAGWRESRRLQGLRQVCSEGGACREAGEDQITRVQREFKCPQLFRHIITFNYHNHPLIRFCLALQMKELRLRETACSVQVHSVIKRRWESVPLWRPIRPLPMLHLGCSAERNRAATDKTWLIFLLKLRLNSGGSRATCSTCHLPWASVSSTTWSWNQTKALSRAQTSSFFSGISLFLPKGMKEISHLYPSQVLGACPLSFSRNRSLLMASWFF